jgi:hypothetical protein
MAIRWYDDEGKRFYVIDVRGYRIDPRNMTRKTSGSSRPSVTYAVLDRDDCHSEVAVFEPGHGKAAATCQKEARDLAARLNEEEDACLLAS